MKTDLKTAIRETELTVECMAKNRHRWALLPLEHVQALLAALQQSPQAPAPYDPAHACPDCPIGGQDGTGPVCPNAAACDRQCHEGAEVMQSDAG